MRSTPKISTSLWKSSKNTALLSATIPFVINLSKGVLCPHVYSNYIDQDIFFLSCFKNAFSDALSLSISKDDMKGKHAFSKLISSIDVELKMHDAVTQNTHNAEKIQPAAATSLYTEFLGQICRSSDHISHICAALTPCMKLYNWLGTRMKSNTISTTITLSEEDNRLVKVNPYQHWIDQYSHQEFTDYTLLLEELLDYYAEKENQSVTDLLPFYEQAMQYEYYFFASQPHLETWNGLERPIQLLGIDFDDTLSQGDTISILCNNAIRAYNKLVASSKDELATVKSSNGSSTITTTCTNGTNKDVNLYQTLFENYIQQYNTFIQTHLPSTPVIPTTDSGSRTFPQQEFETFMKQYSDFETAMLDPVEETKLTEGLSVQDIHEIAKTIKIQSYSMDFIEYAIRHCPGMETHILSLNWCKGMVQSILKQHIYPSSYNKIDFHMNDLVMNDHGITNGDIMKLITGPTHKRDTLQSLTAKVSSATCTNANANTTTTTIAYSSNGSTIQSAGYTVFIGDSLGDLQSLLCADIGVLLGNTSSTIRKVCHIYGIQIRPLEDIILNSDIIIQNKKSVFPIIYEAESWPHIGYCLFGKRYMSYWLSNRVHEMKSGSIHTDSETVLTKDSSSSLHKSTHIRIPKVLIAAGSDSGGGAGIQADIKTCEALQVFSTTAITSLTAQNTHGVTAVHKTESTMLRAQLDAVLSDIGTDTLKVGMCPSYALAMEISRAVMKYSVPHVVVDPVMVSTSGSLLMEEKEAYQIVRTLFPLATIITPNIPEALSILKLLSQSTNTNSSTTSADNVNSKSKDRNDDSVPLSSINTIEDMKKAAKLLYAFGASYVLIKGGHLASHSSSTDGKCIDILYDGNTYMEIPGTYIHTSNLHGTGCTLASAISAELARGHTVPQAVLLAKQYLTTILKHSMTAKIGNGKNGPMLHYSTSLVSKLTTPKPITTSKRTYTDMNESTLSAIEERRKRCNLAVYAVTDATLNKKLGHTMEDVVERTIAGGATIVQLREKDIDTRDFINLAKRLVPVTRRYNVPLIINDRVDVALAADADGVHVGQSDMHVSEVRALLGEYKIIGVSADTIDEAMEAQECGADYVGVGAVYNTVTKADAGDSIGISGLRHVCDYPPLNVGKVAIGGISASRVEECIVDGHADGVAVVSAIFGQKDIVNATQEIAESVRGAFEKRRKSM